MITQIFGSWGRGQERKDAEEIKSLLKQIQKFRDNVHSHEDILRSREIIEAEEEGI